MPKKEGWMALRIDPEDKKLIERAAAIVEVPVSEFVRNLAISEAASVLRRELERADDEQQKTEDSRSGWT